MKILLADGNKSSRAELATLLSQWGYATTIANDGTSVLKEMARPHPPRLLILEWKIPRLSGRNICRRLRKQETYDPPYIIFLTTEDTCVQALEEGASDFVPKPFDPEELRARIGVGERTLKLQADLNAAQRVMAYLAMNDPLTSVYNRRALLKRLEEELFEAKRMQKGLCVAIVDLDYFKKINDTYGHLVGDAVIVAFTRAVQSIIRGSDILGRWGGEEFLMIVPCDSKVAPRELFEIIRDHIQKIIIPIAHETIRFTVSMGVTVSLGDESPAALVKRADEALLAAKEKGRNQIVYAPLPGPPENSWCKLSAAVGRC